MTESVHPPSRARRVVRWIGLLGGPLLALAAYAALPETYVDAAGARVALPPAGRATLALMAWMGTWWLTEAIDVAATSLLPLAYLPLSGAAGIEAAARPYADPLIFLFVGGFLLALSMQRWGLDRRIALIALRVVGTRPSFLVGGFMVTTAVLSAFVSNTATTAMMLPIALSLVAVVGGESDGGRARNLAPCLMLAIAYSASIGGVASLISSPTNGILAAFSRGTLGREITFLGWLAIGTPLSVAFLPLCWLLLTRVLHPLPREELTGGAEAVRAARAALGPMKRGEWITFAVFSLTAMGWMTRPWLQRWLPGLSDPGIAITAGLALFALPVAPRRGEFALDWDTARHLPFGVLFVFGGGLSLAAAVQASGVAEFLGAQAVAAAGLPPLLVIALVTAAVVFLTELTSNTATAATLLPVLAALAPGLGLEPYLLLVPATLAASCAFMMPVATPPNAIVFGSGLVDVPQMARAGLWLNLLSIALITALAATLLPWVWGPV